MKKTFAAICLIAATSAMAAPPQPGNASAPGNQAAIETALKECAAQVKADASGKPDRAAFDACMSAKGFEKPSGPPPGGKPKDPPPQ